MKPTVRALVYFAKHVESAGELKQEIEHGVILLSNVEEEIRSLGYAIFTKRISFSGLPADLSSRVVDYLDRSIIASIGYSRSLTPQLAVELASLGLYVPILHPSEPDFELAKVYSEVFHKASSIDPLVATRIAVGLHDTKFQTPYFPDSSSTGSREIGLSFLYAGCVLEDVKSGLSIDGSFYRVFRDFEKLALRIESLTGLRVKVDYSLSPWMEDSVARLYEHHGFSIASTGSAYFTWFLNKLVQEHMNKALATGFNEVMLPYAEDSLLMEYGLKGLLRARDFLNLATTCVAGIDMVVVPENRPRLAGLIADAMSIAKTKSRPIAARIIPVPAQPGDLVNLGRFGKAPVIPY